MDGGGGIAARLRHFTLHVRLTRGCNAHCTYCSSAGMGDDRMRPDDFARAVSWIADHVFPRLGVGPKHHLTIEYLGGEALILPPKELQRAVETARAVFGPKVKNLRDGVQTNLIGTPRRIDDLVDLFQDRIGTSWDRRTGQRHIKGDATLYDAMLDRSLRHLQGAHGITPGRVLVVDAHSAPHLSQEVEDAAKGGYNLVLRPVFNGGSPGVDHADLDTLVQAYSAAWDTWRRLSSHHPGWRVDPFADLWERREKERAGAWPHGGCPFQSDCAWRSLSLDPDGTIYVCQEMADSSMYPLGNALEGRFEEATWRRLSARSHHLDASCKRCPWLASCGGGCMQEAIARFGDPFAKTDLCAVWTALFTKMDAAQARPALQEA